MVDIIGVVGPLLVFQRTSTFVAFNGTNELLKRVTDSDSYTCSSSRN